MVPLPENSIFALSFLACHELLIPLATQLQVTCFLASFCQHPLDLKGEDAVLAHAVGNVIVICHITLIVI